jgi:hypothetical protein
MRKSILFAALLLGFAAIALPRSSAAQTFTPVNLALIQGTMTQSAPYIDPVTGVSLPNRQFIQVQVYKNIYGLYAGNLMFSDSSWLMLNTNNVGIFYKTATSITIYAHVAYKSLYDVVLLTVTNNVMVNDTPVTTVDLKIMDPMGRTLYLERSGAFDPNSIAIF